MDFDSPWNLLWLLGVAGVAVFTLLHPTRRAVVVPSLRLWTQAAGQQSQSVSRRRRRVSLPWMLLLLGAIFGVLALSKPQLHSPTTDAPVQHPPEVPPITLDAFAAKPMPNGEAEVFISLQNNAGDQRKVFIKLTGNPNAPAIDKSATISSNATISFIERIPAASVIEVSFGSVGETVDEKISKSQLVQRTRHRAKIAVIGPLSALLRRYIEADDILEFTPNSGDTDVLLTNGIAIPKNWTKPALSINPPQPPTGWRRGEQLQNFSLTSAHGATGPILKNVDLTAIVIRHLTPWIPGDNPQQIVVARLGTNAIILRNDPTATTTPLPPRVSIAFDCSAENTNLPLTQQYVVLMGNIFRWIIPKSSGKAIYEKPSTETKPDITSNIPRWPRSNFQLWGYLTAIAILFWVAGWATGGKTTPGGGGKNCGVKEQQ
jgi:hypothetical protein